MYMCTMHECVHVCVCVIIHTHTHSPSLLSPSTPHQLLIKALGLLVNLMQNKDESNSLMSNHGNSVVGTMVSLFQANPTNEITEQLICVLVNIASSSSQSGDVILHCGELLRCVEGVMVRTHTHTVYCMYVL